MMKLRRVQLVSTKSQRKAVLQWVITKVEEDGTDTRIAAQSVGQLPNLFKKTSRRANREMEQEKRVSFCYPNSTKQTVDCYSNSSAGLCSSKNFYKGFAWERSEASMVEKHSSLSPKR